MEPITTIDAYIADCPAEVQPLLHELRRAIAQAAPTATEKISWGMATFVLHGNLVHFSAEKKHIGLHPDPSAIEAFREALADYSCSKGTVRLPYDQPLPLDLIRQMVVFRVEEQMRRFAKKQSGEKAPPRVLRSRYEMPDDVAEALNQEGLQVAYQSRPPYQRNDYIGWIVQAKQSATREKRLRQMLDELVAGNVYMGRPYQVKKDGLL